MHYINIVVVVKLNSAGLGRLPGRRLQRFAPASRPAGRLLGQQLQRFAPASWPATHIKLGRPRPATAGLGRPRRPPAGPR